MSNFKETDKERVKSLIVRENSVFIPKVSERFKSGDVIDRSNNEEAFNAAFETEIKIAPKGKRTNEVLEVNEKRTPSLDKGDDWFDFEEDMMNFYDKDSDVIVRDSQIYNKYDVSVGNKPKFVDVANVKDPRYCLMNMHESPGYVILFEIFDKGEPIERDYISISNGPNAVKFDINSEDTAYVVTNTGLTRKLKIDNRNLINKKQVDSGGQIFNLDMDSSHVYCAGASGDGLIIIDKNDMKLISKTTFNAGDVSLKNEYVFITDYSNADLRVYDKTDKSSPSLVTTLSVGSFPVNVKVHGDYAYINEYNGDNINVVDISDPTSPTIVNMFFPAGESLNRGGIFVKGDYLYVFSDVEGDLGFPDADSALEVFSGASDPSSLTKEFSYAFPSNARIEPPAMSGERFWVPDFGQTKFAELKNPFIWNDHLKLQELDVLKRVGDLPFTPSDSSNWSGSDPTTIQEAINRIAASIASNHNPIS